MNLLKALEIAHAVEIDDDFIRHFNFESDATEDEVMLDAGEHQFTAEEMEKAVFDEDNDAWEVAGCTITCFEVKQMRQEA